MLLTPWAVSSTQRLTPTDKEPLPTGPIRWRNRVHWIRFRLVERGLIDRSAPRGVWRLTEAGKAEAARLAEKESFMTPKEIRYTLDREGYVVAAKAERKPIDDPHARGEPCGTRRAPALYTLSSMTCSPS